MPVPAAMLAYSRRGGERAKLPYKQDFLEYFPVRRVYIADILEFFPVWLENIANILEYFAVWLNNIADIL